MGSIFTSCFRSKNTNVINPLNKFDISRQLNTEIISLKDTIKYIPPVTEGVVINVHDGDTITIATKMYYCNKVDDPLFRFSVRLRGIDSAEITSHTFAEKNCAILARNALNEKVFYKNVVLKNVALEKYGRILADVYLDNENINKWMLDNNYAVKYDGKTKYRPPEWDGLLEGIDL